MIDTLFLVGAITLGLAMVGFFFTGKKTAFGYSASAVAAATLLSYLVMMDGSLVITAASGEPIYYTRWFFYIISCSILMGTISSIMGVGKKVLPYVLVFNGLVMLTGPLMAIMAEPMNYIVFAVGCLFFIMQIVLIAGGDNASKEGMSIWPYIIGGWSLFPVVFLLGPAGIGTFTAATAALLYLILDLVTKVVFYLHMNARAS